MSEQLVYIVTIVLWKFKSGSFISVIDTGISVASFTYKAGPDGQNMNEVKYLPTTGSWDK
jgi:hypothetical protein